MKKACYSKELARLYERQGYYSDALEQFSALYQQKREQRLADAVARLKKKVEREGDPKYMGRVAQRIEEWIRLLAARQKLETYKRLMKRFQ